MVRPHAFSRGLPIIRTSGDVWKSVRAALAVRPGETVALHHVKPEVFAIILDSFGLGPQVGGQEAQPFRGGQVESRPDRRWQVAACWRR